MVTLIHGDDLATSRTYYLSLKTPQSETFEGDKVTVEQLQTVLQTLGLFGDEKQICLENFFSKRKPSKEMEAIIDLINTNNHATLLFWESKKLTKTQSGKIKTTHIKEFSLPKSLFSFLDAVKPGNTTLLLRLYHETLSQTDAEMIFAMLTRQIRILVALSDTESDTIDEIKRLSPWQQKKFISQSNFFSKDQLIKLHTQLFHLDVKSKTGELSLPLSESIDFFLSTI